VDSLSDSSPNIFLAIDSLADYLMGSIYPVSGVFAQPHLSEYFANKWSGLLNVTWEVGLAQRLHLLAGVNTDKIPSKGYMRPVTESDLDNFMAWEMAFHLEALREEPDEFSRQRMLERSKASYFWVNDEGVIVSLAGTPRETWNTIAIGPVYTPPEYRRCGFASALVATLSQHHVNNGKRCLLITDLANATSNKIYAEVGYEPLCDFTQRKFISL